MQGGINNAALFGASQRSARSKLDQMAGIKRPSGILASSPELIQAAMPARPPMPPVMQQSPASMVGAPMVPPAMPTAPMMPNMPMPTTVAPRSLNPMAAAPTTGQPVVQLNEGGFLDRVKESVNKIPGKMAEAGMFRNPPADAVDITIEPSEFDRILKTLNPQSTKYLLETYGDEAGIAQAAQRKLNNIEAAAKSKDPAQTADQVLTEAGEQPTDAAKKDFAENVLGLDIDDIDEINRRIDNVVVGNAVGKGSDAFAAAVVMGLQGYKQTASARAAGAASAAGGSSFTKDRTALRAYQDTLDSLTRSLGDRDLPEGYEGTVADYAAEQALKQVLQTYPMDQIPPQLLNQADGQPAPRRSEPPAGGLETFLVEAQKINPDSSVEELTEFYTKKYGG